MVKHVEEMTSRQKARPPVEDDESMYSSSESGFGEPRSPLSPEESRDFDSLYRRIVADCPRLRLIAGRTRGQEGNLGTEDGGDIKPSGSGRCTPQRKGELSQWDLGARRPSVERNQSCDSGSICRGPSEHGSASPPSRAIHCSAVARPPSMEASCCDFTQERAARGKEVGVAGGHMQRRPVGGNSWDSGIVGLGQRAPLDPLGLGLGYLEPAAPLKSGDFMPQQDHAAPRGFLHPGEKADAFEAGFTGRPVVHGPPAYAAPKYVHPHHHYGWPSSNAGCSCGHQHQKQQNQQQQQQPLPPQIGHWPPPYPAVYLPAESRVAAPAPVCPSRDYHLHGPMPPKAGLPQGSQPSAVAAVSAVGGREPESRKRVSGVHGDGRLVPSARQARISSLTPITIRRSHLHESMCKVFITYSLDAAPHVLNLAKFLCANGFNTMLDVFADQLRGIDVIKFMDTFLLDKDYMIIVAVSPGYRRDVEGSVGSLDTDDHSLHTRYIFRQLQNQFIQQGCLNFRVIPVLMPPASKDDVPSWLQSTLCFRWPRDLEGILLRLMREEKIVPPPVGELPTITMVPV
ncbi:E3 ubiquitin ligase TRAF3IP2-like isoform X1 [Lethenteron reissneri]|uniref:E3 ubiquitin ligase TRAF3IP2-like isoform X1 n=2 Tax=Lethenteron reissneri TaxID=7753 RepID=UPI002AB72075|nr:E3 ubiquitin ligase TRAF3IP2-like isoform X1 [Lethenteron reissneri]